MGAFNIVCNEVCAYAKFSFTIQKEGVLTLRSVDACNKGKIHDRNDKAFAKCSSFLIRHHLKTFDIHVAKPLEDTW